MKSVQAPQRKLGQAHFFLFAILFPCPLTTEATEKNRNTTVSSLQVRSLTSVGKGNKQLREHWSGGVFFLWNYCLKCVCCGRCLFTAFGMALALRVNFIVLFTQSSESSREYIRFSYKPFWDAPWDSGLLLQLLSNSWVQEDMCHHLPLPEVCKFSELREVFLKKLKIIIISLPPGRRVDNR